MFLIESLRHRLCSSALIAIGLVGAPLQAASGCDFQIVGSESTGRQTPWVPHAAAKSSGGWIRFEVPPGSYELTLEFRNDLNRPAACIIRFFGQPGLARLYSKDVSEPLGTTGWLLPVPERAPRAGKPLLELAVPPGIHHFRLQVEVPDPPLRPLYRLEPRVESLEDYLPRKNLSTYVMGLYAGVNFAVVFYNLFLFLLLRQRVYLAYVFYALSFGSIWMVREGHALELLWPSLPQLDARLDFFLFAAALVTGNSFTTSFLGLRHRAIPFYQVLVGSSVAGLAAVVLRLAQVFDPARIVLALAGSVAVCTYLVAGWWAWRWIRGATRYYLVALVALAIGLLIYLLAFFGVLPIRPWTAHAAQAGSALEMLLLAFALGQRVREVELEKLEIERSYVARLEAEVEGRTLELRKANESLAELSLTDPLTGVANRRQWDVRFSEEFRRAVRSRQPLSILILDVDHFKRYNDRFGHQAGDEALRRVAGVIQSLARRPGDLVARYGGEEFAVLLPGTPLQQAKNLALRMVGEVATLGIDHPDSGVRPHLTMSCGVAACEEDFGLHSEELLERADRALYRAKQSGRNRVEVEAMPSPRRDG